MKIRHFIHIISLFTALFFAGSLLAVAQVCTNAKELLITKSLDDYDANILDKINLITLQPGILPSGSYKYKFIKYPGDIDIFEPMLIVSGRKEAKKAFALALSEMAKSIESVDDVYWSELKAGVDPDLVIDVGTVTEPGKIPSDYAGRNVQWGLASLLDKGLITSEFFNEAYSLASIKLFQSFEGWLALRELIDKNAALRWTLDEVKNQEKQLISGNTISLADAIENGFTKIDLIAPVANNGGYTELSNVFYFRFGSIKGTADRLIEKIVGYGKLKDWILGLFGMEGAGEKILSLELQDHAFSLENEIAALTQTSKPKILKAVKRMFSLAKVLKDWELLVKLAPIINSPPAQVGQIIAESDAVRRLFTHPNAHEVKCDSVGNRIAKQLSTFRKRLLGSDPATFIKTAHKELLDNIMNGARDLCLPGELFANQGIINGLKDQLKALEVILEKRVDETIGFYIQQAGIDISNPKQNYASRPIKCPNIPSN